MAPPETRPGLRRNQLSFVENLAQSVGNMAPSGGVALTIQLAFALSGNGTWLVYVLVLGAYWLIAKNVNEFARRTASPGAFYHFAELGLGPLAGLAAGWTYVICLVFCLMSPALTFAHYGLVFWQWAALPGGDGPVGLAILVAGLGLATAVSIRGVRVSADLILLMECVSVGLMLVLAAVFFLAGHRGVDTAQLKLSGVTWGGLRAGSVIGLFALSGFESVVAFGGESKSALHTIPRAVIAGIIPAGLLFAFMSYVLIFSFRGAATPLDQAAAPFDHLAAVCGLPFFGHLINAGVMMSFFACSLAGLNAGARVLYALSRQQLVPRGLGTVEPRAGTPRVALLTVAAGALAICGLGLAARLTLDQCIDYATQIGSFGYILSYMVVCVSAPCYLHRRGELAAGHLAAAAAALVILALPLGATFYPVPSGLPRFFPYLTLAAIAAATAASLGYRRRQARAGPLGARPAEAPAA